MEICGGNILLLSWVCPWTVRFILLCEVPMATALPRQMAAARAFLFGCEKLPHVERTSSAAFITLTSIYCKMGAKQTVAQLRECNISAFYINNNLNVLLSQHRRKARSVCFRTHELPGRYWVSLGHHVGNTQYVNHGGPGSVVRRSCSLKCRGH